MLRSLKAMLWILPWACLVPAVLDSAIPLAAQEKKDDEEEPVSDEEIQKQLDELFKKEGIQNPPRIVPEKPAASTAQPPAKTAAERRAEAAKKRAERDAARKAAEANKTQPPNTAVQQPPPQPVRTPPNPNPVVPGQPRPGDVPRGPTTPVTNELAPEEEEQYLLPFDQRQFKFGVKDVEYAELVQMFSRMFSLPLVGDAQAPQGKVSFVSTEPLDFKEAIAQLRMLLFRSSPLDPYWIRYRNGALELLRVADVWRTLDLEKIFPTLAAFEEASLDDSELALLVYTPGRGSVAELEHIRDFMPDYVRVAPLAERNAVTISALVSDIHKYLDLVHLFGRAPDDPRTLKRIPVNNMAPSKAVEYLSKLMDLTPQVPGQPPQPRAPRPGRDPNSPFAQVVSQGISYYPDDEQGVIVVLAMEDEIERMEKLLEVIDISVEGEPPPPVVIQLKHARVEEVHMYVNQVLTQPGAQAMVTRPRNRKGAQPTPQPAGIPGSDTPTTLADSRNNRLIVIGSEQGVAMVKVLVGVFDVPRADSGPRHITVSYVNADQIAQPIATLIMTDRPPSTQGVQQFSCVPDGSGGLFISGTPQDMDRAEALIREMDVPDPDPPTIHTVRLRHAKPSSLVQVLTVWLTNAPAPAPVAPSGGKAARRNRAPTAAAAAGGTFQPDDANMLLHVVATKSDFDTRFLPVIEQLDAEAQFGKYQIIPVVHLTPQELVSSLQALVDPASAGQTRLVPMASGVLISGAPESEIARLTEIARALDVDPLTAGLVETRRFDLEHADPLELKTLLESILTTGVGVPQPGTPDKGRGPAQIQVPGTQVMVTIVALPTALKITAPKARMTDLAALIQEFDVPGSESEMRVYPFPPGTNVDAIASALQAIYTGTAMPKAVQTSRRNRSNRQPQPAAPATATAAEVKVFPMAVDRKIAVLAPVSLFEDIEATIEKLTPEAHEQSLDIKFFALEYADPTALMAQIEPTLKARLAYLVATGKIVLPDGSKGPTDGLLTMTPDTAGSRLVVTAPAPVIEEAGQLIAQFDIESTLDERIIKTVALDRADAKQMVDAITAIIATSHQTVAATGGGGREWRRRGQTQPATPTSMPDVSIIAAPGGGGVVLSGLVAEVERIQSYVKQLDENASSGKMLKVYDLANCALSPEDMADIVMNIVDGGKGGGRAPATKDAGSLDVEFDFDFDTLRKGSDVVVKTDYFAKTMLVSASPGKMREIDEIVELYESPELLAGGAGSSNFLKPLMYPLKHADAWDAMYTLEDILDVVWVGGDKPKVDYISGTDILVVKGKPDRYKEVEDLIKTWVDKPDEKKSERRTFIKRVDTGALPSDLAQTVIEHLPPGIRVVGMPAPKTTENDIAKAYIMQVAPGPETDEDEEGSGDDSKGKESGRSDEQPAEKEGNVRVEMRPKEKAEVRPCVLPGMLFAQRTFASATIGQSQGNELTEDEIKERRDIRRSIFPTSQVAEDEPVQADKSETTRLVMQVPEPAEVPADAADPVVDPASAAVDEDVPPEEPLKIIWDDERRVLILEGPKDAVRAAQDSLDDVLKELEKMQGGIDIRVFRLRFVDVNVAAQILEAMFGSGNPMRGMNPQQIQQMMAAQQAVAQRQAAQQARQAAGQAGQAPGGINIPGMPNIPGMGGRTTGRGERRGEDGKEGADVATETAEAAAAEQVNIRVFPDTRTQTIIVRADTEDFPDIIKLLATIDKPGKKPSTYRIFGPLENLVASEVETMLRSLLGLDSRGGTSGGGQRRMPQMPRGGDPAQVAQQIQQQMMQFAMEGGAEGTIGANEQVNITSFSSTNSVMVMAPQSILDLIEDLIEKMEKQEFVGTYEHRTYPLKHADAAEMVVQLTALFPGSTTGGSSGSRRGGGGGQNEPAVNPLEVNAPDFVAAPRTNTLIVRAMKIDFPKIEPMIDLLDVPSTLGTTAEIISISFGDATSIAKTLQEFYAAPQTAGAPGSRGASASSSSVKIVAESASNSILVTAPPTQMSEIKDKIAQMDTQGVGGIVPRVIALERGNAKIIAQTLSDAFGASSRKGREAVRIVGDESSRKLFVTASDNMFEQIKELATQLDIATAGVEVRVIPLVHARAADIYAKLKEMMTNYIALAGKGGMEPFTAVADERSNSLVVLASQSTFEMLAPLLQKVDIPDAGPVKRVTMIYQLVKARADEVASNINTLFSKAEKGIEPPKAVANAATNALIVEGTKEQTDRIYGDVISKLEEFAATEADLITETLQLAHAPADLVAESLKKIFTEQKQVLSDAKKVGIKPSELTVGITADPDTNQLVVLATPKNIETIKARLAEMDKPGVFGPTARDTVVFPVKYADPNTVATAVRETYPKGPKTAERDIVTAVPDTSSQSVIVTASKERIESIRDMIAQLDKQGDESRISREARVYQLKYAEPTGMAEMINQSFSQQGRQIPERDRVTAAAAWMAQGVMVTASLANHDRIAKIVEALDVSGAVNNPAQVVVLEHVRAGEVEPLLTKLYVEGARSGGPGGRFFGGRGGGSADTPVIVANEAANSLIIRAKTDDAEQIKQMIATLDVEPRDAPTKFDIIPLPQGVNASDLAQTVESFFNDGEQARTANQQGARPQRIAVRADMRSNALILAGSPTLSSEAKLLVDKLIDMKPVGRQAVRIIKTVNMDPEDLKKAIEQVVPSNEGSSSSQRRRGGGRP